MGPVCGCRAGRRATYQIVRGGAWRARRGGHGGGGGGVGGIGGGAALIQVRLYPLDDQPLLIRGEACRVAPVEAEGSHRVVQDQAARL